MLTSRFSNALLYAAELHASQRRKVSGEPYLAHLLGTASIVLDYGGDEDEAIAALLHDAIEDQGGHVVRAEIVRRFGERVAAIIEGCTDADTFGERVAAIIEGCTDADTIPKPPWRERKEAYLERLRAAAPSVRLVVAADKLHNLRAMTRDYRRLGEGLWKHFKGDREGTLWYYETAAEILWESSESGSEVDRRASPTEELCRTLEELKRLIAETTTQ
jgi:(p)ppGpp synthase/HD superfamily hydrolase